VITRRLPIHLNTDTKKQVHALSTDRVPTGQGKLEKVREFAWSGKVRENLAI